MSLGTLVSEHRVKKMMSVEEVSKIVGIPTEALEQVENGMLPIPVDVLRKLSVLIECPYPKLLSAAREFNTRLWRDEDNDPTATVSSMEEGDVRILSRQIFGDQFFQYREGWIAGAGCRENPGDMSDEWLTGYNDGCGAFESAMHARRTSPSRE